MAHVTLTKRQAATFVERIEAWMVDMRRALRRARTEAEMQRKLRYCNDHLLRDMGLTREDGRIVRGGDILDPLGGRW